MSVSRRAWFDSMRLRTESEGRSWDRYDSSLWFGGSSGYFKHVEPRARSDDLSASVHFSLFVVLWLASHTKQEWLSCPLADGQSVVPPTDSN